MQTKTSGSKQVFDTGAKRDDAGSKPRPDLISPFVEERLGALLQRGAAHYGDHNWTKGMPFSRCLASLQRHLMQWKQGDKSEDHLAAVMFDAMAIIHYEEMISRGVLPSELDDMPVYLPIAKEVS